MKPIEEARILDVDGPRPATFSWTVRECNGMELYLYDGTPPEPDGEGGWKGLEPVTEREALKPGVQILVPGMFNELIVMTVEAGEHGELHGRSRKKDGSPGQLTGLLKYGEDERGVWACIGLINMSAVTKLELFS